MPSRSTLSFYITLAWASKEWGLIAHNNRNTMETTKQPKDFYLSPKMDVFDIKFEGCLCQSPGGGGSEGTGNEPLFP